jgi:predicted small metal-binding protein
MPRIMGLKQPPLTREETMAKQMTCRDAGTDCPGQFRVETEDELMKHIEVHAKAAHPDLPITPEFQRQVKSLIKTV